jgi:kinase-associated protein B
MSEMLPDIGTLVRAVYKSGEYVGEIVDVNPPKATVKVLAVLKHPTQGDLHNPYEADVPLFHQRKALGYSEKANMFLTSISPYGKPIPGYRESLEIALNAEMDYLEKTIKWASLSLEQLDSLKREYT